MRLKENESFENEKWKIGQGTEKNVKKTKGHICQDCISNEVAKHLFGYFSV